MTTRSIIPLLIVLLFTVAGCRAANEPTEPGEMGVEITLAVDPVEPTVGDATLLVTVQTADGDPINDAQISLRGDMDHAGMQPVNREVSSGEDGQYTVPFEWTMGGDWFVVVTATLADGTVVEQTFDYTVDGEMNMDMGDEEDMGDMEMSEDDEMDMDMSDEEDMGDMEMDEPNATEEAES
ncbi:MAG: FixH family protein [Chloroflexota bacterium]